MRPDHSQHVRLYYDETLWLVSNFWTNQKVLAAHVGYWEADTRNDREAQANMNRILAERVAIQPGEHVLDAGCGMGGSAFWLAENRGACVFGVTLSPRQARLAVRAAARRDLSRHTSFSLQDYTATAFPDESFDVVWAIESVCYALAKSAFFEEALRVLRPGGRLILSDGFRRARNYPEADERLMRRWLDGWALLDMDTPDEFVASACAAGFTDVRFDDVTDRIRPSVDRLHLLSHWTAPLGSALSRVGLLSPVVARAMWANNDTYDVIRGGLSIYGIMSATKPRWA
jgi:tocopherol O-methyltransferase